MTKRPLHFTALSVAALALSGTALTGIAFAQEEFQKPGSIMTGPPPDQNPNALPPPPPEAEYRQVPIPDRNRIMDALGVPDQSLNPYQQSTLKGDRPVFDDWFVVLSAISDSLYESRTVPVPTNVVSTNRQLTNDQFGRPGQSFFSQTLIPTFSIIKGDTTFKPPEFEFTVTPAVSYTHLGVGEFGITDINPAKGKERDSGFVGFQEAFIDYHIRNVSDRYDFDSVRVGIQPMNVDFRGFLFQDQQLGVRFFGDRDNNRFQYNIAYFRRIEKDTNSGFNDLSKPLRRDNIAFANLFVQDLPVTGYTSEFSVVENWNNETGFHYDTNGFQVRPAELGFDAPHKYNVTYLGFNGDGHFGRLNLTHSFYYALGHDSVNELTGKEANIRGFFAALEPSIDFDWIRIRGSFLYSSGDDDPRSGTESGFDAINENPQFAGADSSYYIREGIPFIGGGGVTLTGPNSVIPALRSSKDEGQSNFINPGILLLGVGADFDVLPELRISANANHLSFNNTKILELLREQSHVSNDFGWDLSTTANYRPFDTQNVIFRFSGAVLVPGDGFKDLLASNSNDKLYYSVVFNLILAY
jgi:hypothetical protein